MLNLAILYVRVAVLPIGYYCVHQSAIRALAWVRVPDRRGNGPTVIASGGYDGLQCLTDIRDFGGHVFNRTRGAHPPPTCLVLIWKDLLTPSPHRRCHQQHCIFTIFERGCDDRS